ncbi:hypothetical protein SDC9_38224 [bioreactor metagenome]|uniref:Uncharacterized protein n=1 Tax=bioreactor metagenome TaxID=1076179 RepID=A0A644VLL1_9ZZZZ
MAHHLFRQPKGARRARHQRAMLEAAIEPRCRHERQRPRHIDPRRRPAVLCADLCAGAQRHLIEPHVRDAIDPRKVARDRGPEQPERQVPLACRRHPSDAVAPQRSCQRVPRPPRQPPPVEAEGDLTARRRCRPVHPVPSPLLSPHRHPPIDLDR